MNRLLARTGRVTTDAATLVAEIFGMFYLALSDVTVLKETGKRRIFWQLFKRYFYNAGIRAVYINTMFALLLGWLLITTATLFLPEGAALGSFFQSLYVIVAIREIGPMISGFILISRSANAATSEISYMKLNGEFEVLHSQRIDPFILFLAPVFFAFPVSLLMMFVYFTVVCVLSSYLFLAASAGLGENLVQFVSGIASQISAAEIVVSAAKAIIGGSVIAIISIYFGSRVRGGYTSVSRAISVSTSVQIFAFMTINLLLSYIAYR